MSKENALFNDITIRRLVLDIKLTTKQKKASQNWLKLIEEGKLIKEKQGYLKFYDIILKELLSYDNIKHEKEGVEFSYEKDGKSIVRIEAKGMDTKDLFLPQKRARKESPVQQLWRYMQLHASPYGIVTNYKTFILFKYDVGSTKYYVFDFEDIKKNPNKLKEFVAIFSRENIDNEFIEDLYEKSIIEEREFTKEFYKLYHETRLMLIKEFEENSDISRGASVHFAQIFLNRLMFVFFAEDTGKIDKRLVEDRILKTLDNIHLFSSNSSNISNVLVGLFKDLDKGSDFPIKLFGFNGGLFEHPIPAKIYFKDFRDNKFFGNVNQYSKLKKKDLELNEKEKEIFEKYKNKFNPIIKNVLLMASFDFNTEVNVNILGHIFEQSISDIEDLKTDKSSRRKKEGIFYTPKYITDYICRNTIIPYLSEKGANEVPDLIKEYSDNIEELEKKFKAMKILDPACGSGAFLIKATSIMLEIFKAIQEFKQQEGEYEAKRGLKRKSNKKGQLVLEKWNEEAKAREIIENSIYGVDLNEESVEITKLALFLKMARKNRKLTDLSENIKQGNSLIDDEEVAGKLAFDWSDKEKGFGKIMDDGGFDVVIGNPPYVKVQNLKHEEIDWYKSNKKSAFKRVDISILFIELAKKLLKKDGLVCFITSNQFLVAEYGRNARKFILDELKIVRIIDFGDLPVFENALTYVSIFTLQNSKGKNFDYLHVRDIETARNKSYKGFIRINIKDLTDDSWNLTDKKEIALIKKIEQNTKLKEGIGKCWYGIVSGNDDVFIINENKYKIEKEVLLPLIRAHNCGRYSYVNFDKRIIYPYFKEGNNTLLISLNEMQRKYPECFKYLSERKKILQQRKDSRKTFEDSDNWYSLTRFGKKQIFDKEKIVFPGENKKNKFSIDTNQAGYSGARVFSITVENEKISILFLLSILNSKVLEFYLHSVAPLKQGGYYSYSSTIIDKLPIPKISPSEQKPFIEKAEKMLKLNKEFYEKKDKFLTMLKSDFGLDKVSKNLQRFYELDWKGFEDELRKKKISLSGKIKDDWFDRFNRMSKEVRKLKEDIDKTDGEINKMVYKLYGLTKEEIKIVEESLK